MSKLEGWNPKRRAVPKYDHDHEEFRPGDDEDELFSYHTFERYQELTTRLQILDSFYLRNPSDADYTNPWISVVLDPPAYTAPGTHSYWIVHYSNYFTQIQISLRGPTYVHRCRLFYRQQCHRGDSLWIGTAQLGPVYFYSQSQVIELYRQILSSKAFFQSEKEGKKIVSM